VIQEAIANRNEQFLPTLGMLAVLWAVSMSLFFYNRGFLAVVSEFITIGEIARLLKTRMGAAGARGPD
jgi:hypothetical protein